jgi:FkbM family methyltransferase
MYSLIKRSLKKKLLNFLSNRGYTLSPSNESNSKGIPPYAYFSLPYCFQLIQKSGIHIHSILDIGANSAIWSKEAKKFFPEAVFYLIEPQIEMEPFLIEFCKNSPKSKYFLAGAGPKKDKLTLTLWKDLQGSSLLLEPSVQKIADGVQRSVPIVSVDELIESAAIQIPSICKLDIQGFELEALKGAEKLFGYTEIFIIEVSLYEFLPTQPLINEVISFMYDRKYTIYDIPGYSHRPLDGALAQVDVCFVKSDSKLVGSNLWQ